MFILCFFFFLMIPRPPISTRTATLFPYTTLFRSLGSETALMVDANQGWTVEQALAVLPLLRPFDLDWLEEPLAVDAPAADWARLVEAFPIPLAAGENLRGEAAFDAALDEIGRASWRERGGQSG